MRKSQSKFVGKNGPCATHSGEKIRTGEG